MVANGPLSRSVWPQGEVGPPSAQRMSFRLAGVQLPRSSGMQWKMKHLANHTVELLHPSQPWILAVWEFRLCKPSGRLGGKWDISGLVPSCLQL